MQDKFKFCSLELSGWFLKNIFNLSLVESVDMEPMVTKGQLRMISHI